MCHVSPVLYKGSHLIIIGDKNKAQTVSKLLKDIASN